MYSGGYTTNEMLTALWLDKTKKFISLNDNPQYEVSVRGGEITCLDADAYDAWDSKRIPMKYLWQII